MGPAGRSHPCRRAPGLRVDDRPQPTAVRTGRVGAGGRAWGHGLHGRAPDRARWQTDLQRCGGRHARRRPRARAGAGSRQRRVQATAARVDRSSDRQRRRRPMSLGVDAGHRSGCRPARVPPRTEARRPPGLRRVGSAGQEPVDHDHATCTVGPRLRRAAAAKRSGHVRAVGPGRLTELLDGAGFLDVEIDSVPILRTYASVVDWLGETRDLSRQFAAVWAELGDEQRQALRDHITAAAGDYADPSGALALPGSTLAAAASA